MQTIRNNLQVWNNNFDWKERGDEWSVDWGGVDMQWFFVILPRIHSFVPTGTILEIAPGFGRWTQFLVHLCKNLILVDLSEKCIEACKERFKSYSNITYYVNDGVSLEMIPDQSIDFVFSFDSLVHVEDTVIEAYLNQLSKKIKQDGAGFIHHSNLGEYKTYFSLINKIPERIKKRLVRFGLIDNAYHWRADSMTAGKFRQFAEKSGFQYIRQEVINWARTERLIDCLSTFKKEGNAVLEDSVQTIRNRKFKGSVNEICKLSSLYRAVPASLKQ